MMILFTIIWIIKGEPIPEISGDGFTLTINGEGTVTKEISRKKGQYDQIVTVIVNEATALANAAFLHFTKMTSITLSDKIQKIGSESFYECISLESLKIPPLVESIEYGTFFDCRAIETIEFSARIQRINMSSLFYRTYNLRKFIVPLDNPKFSTDDKGLYLMSKNGEILYKGPGKYAIEVPKTVKKVVSFFSYKTDITSISFKNSIVECIESKAIIQENLNEIIFPNTMKTITAEFASGSISSVTVPSSVETLDIKAFGKITGLNEIIFPDNSKVLKRINGIIYDINMTSIILVPPTAHRIEIIDKIKNIEQTTVLSHNILEVLGNNEAYQTHLKCLYKGKDHSFLYAVPGGIDVVELHKDCITVGSGSGKSCLVKKIILNENLKNLNFDCFGNCPNLEEVNIPPKLQTIGSWVFTDCKKLNIIGPFPKTLNSLSGFAFRAVNTTEFDFGLCNLIKNIAVSLFQSSQIENIVLPPSLEKIESEAFRECRKLVSIEFPSTLSGISKFSFGYCSSLQSVVFKYKNISQITENSFTSCSALTTISIPDSVTSLGAACFKDCTKLESIVFSSKSSLKSIAFEVVSGCEMLSEFIIRTNVNAIENGAFSGAIGLMNFKVDSSNTHYSDVNGVLFLADKKTLHAFPAGRLKGQIASNVTKISAMAFRECSRLSNLMFEETKQKETDRLESILEYTFYGCSNLTSLRLPGTIAAIEEKAFSGCERLSNVTFGHGSAIKQLSASTFSGCRELSAIIFESESRLESVLESAFEGCSKLATFVFPPTLSLIGKSAFEGCGALRSVQLENVIQIGDRGFFGCRAIEEVTLGGNLKSVGGMAFGDCESLNSVRYCGDVVITGNVFSGAKVSFVYVYSNYRSDKFGGLKTFRILDKECNLPTGMFTRSDSFNIVEVGLLVASMISNNSLEIDGIE